MNKKISSLIISITVSAILLFPVMILSLSLFSAETVLAELKCLPPITHDDKGNEYINGEPTGNKINDKGGGGDQGGGGGGGGSKTLQSLIDDVEDVALDIATPIVIIGWVIAGILYLTAAGAPEKINLAKGAIKACVIGTVLVVLAMSSGAIISIIKNALGFGNN